MKFQTVLEKWLNDKKEYVKESTYAYYHFEVMNYISPLFGSLQLEEVTEERIQKAVFIWQGKGMENGRALKRSTVQNLVMLIKQVLKFATKKGWMENIIIEIHFAPQYMEKSQMVFNPKEQAQLIQAVLDNLNCRTFGILLSINSGLRIGEICALKWGDIDMNAGVLHVTKTLQRIYTKSEKNKTEIIITAPKTPTSIREVPLSKRILSIINTFQSKVPTHYVLTDTDHYMEPRSFRRFYKLFLKENHIKELHFHCLRHTFATRCIEGGADYKSISEILGHATINATLNMYVHPQLEEKRKCVELLEWKLC